MNKRMCKYIKQLSLHSHHLGMVFNVDPSSKNSTLTLSINLFIKQFILLFKVQICKCIKPHEHGAIHLKIK